MLISKAKAVVAAAVGALAVCLGGAASAATPWLRTSGRDIIDPAGNPVTLRGVSIIAPEQNSECHGCGSRPIPKVIGMTADATDTSAGVTGWHSRVVRVPITMKYTKDPRIAFEKYIEPAVSAAIANDLYVIIDLHMVSDYAVTPSRGVVDQKFVLDFWTYVAGKYATTPNVIFELFNEPIYPDNWATWKAFIQPVVDAVRLQAPDNLILIGSPSWSTRVNEARANPIRGENLVYVYHVYPNQGPATAANLDPKFGNAANDIPIMITEFGWGPKGKYSGGVAVGSTSTWGAPMRQYLDARPHISWVSWIFDTFWKPMYFDGSWTLLGGENQGVFMKQWFYDKRADNQPSAVDGANGVPVQWTVEESRQTAP